jgi:hypothetical protein
MGRACHFGSRQLGTLGLSQSGTAYFERVESTGLSHIYKNRSFRQSPPLSVLSLNDVERLSLVVSFLFSKGRGCSDEAPIIRPDASRRKSIRLERKDQVAVRHFHDQDSHSSKKTSKAAQGW